MLDLNKIVKKSLNLNYDEDKYSIKECAKNVYLSEHYDPLEAFFLVERYKADRLVNSMSERIKLDQV